jgi:hypothetical protein
MSGTQSAAPAGPRVSFPRGMGRLNCALSDSNGSVRTAHRQCAHSPALAVSPRPQRKPGGRIGAQHVEGRTHRLATTSSASRSKATSTNSPSHFPTEKRADHKYGRAHCSY